MTSSTLASEFVTDTMGLVLHIEQRRLPPPVKAIFDAVESGNATVYVPTMVFAEILYLTLPRNTESVSHFVQSLSIWSSSSIIENIQ